MRLLEQKRPDPTSADVSIAEVIETALLRLYVARKLTRQLEQLVEGRNHLDLAATEELLVANRRFHALALFFKGRGLGQRALEVWQK